MRCTEAGVASLSPQLGLTLIPQISKWYNYIYDKVFHKTLIVNNPPPSSFSASIYGYTSNSDNSDNESVFVRSPRPSVKLPKDLPPSNLVVDVSTPPILTNHKPLLLAPSPSIEYTKISLQADAQELPIKSPYYK